MSGKRTIHHWVNDGKIHVLLKAHHHALVHIISVPPFQRAKACHATMLHLLALDHEKLTFRYAGRDFRLTDVYSDVVNGIIA